MMFEKRKELFMLASAVIIGAILLWPASESETQQLDQSQSVSSIAELPLPKKKEKTKAVKPQQKALPEPVEALTVEKGMAHEMKRVADIYEQRSKYAPYSLYLSPTQTDLINPNQSHESPRGYDVDGNNISIHIKPKNFRFSTNENIEVDIEIKSSSEGLKAVTKLVVEVMATSSKEKWPMKIISDIQQSSTRSIKAELDLDSDLTSFSKGSSSKDSSSESHSSEEGFSIVVQASFNGESPVIQSAPIKIVTSIAKVVGVGTNRIESNDLIIPIKIETDKSGYYQLSASLFDQKTNSAISFLIAKERLSSGSNTLEAKVQGLVLRDKGFSGPFRLQGLTLVKKSERPGMKEEYGIAEESYSIDAIDLDDFESIPYEDPMTEQRLEFMRSIGQ